jgi:hypothetical protein
MQPTRKTKQKVIMTRQSNRRPASAKTPQVLTIPWLQKNLLQNKVTVHKQYHYPGFSHSRRFNLLIMHTRGDTIVKYNHQKTDLKLLDQKLRHKLSSKCTVKNEVTVPTRPEHYSKTPNKWHKAEHNSRCTYFSQTGCKMKSREPIWSFENPMIPINPFETPETQSYRVTYVKRKAENGKPLPPSISLAQTAVMILSLILICVWWRRPLSFLDVFARQRKATDRLRTWGHSWFPELKKMGLIRASNWSMWHRRSGCDSGDHSLILLRSHPGGVFMLRSTMYRCVSSDSINLFCHGPAVYLPYIWQVDQRYLYTFLLSHVKHFGVQCE